MRINIRTPRRPDVDHENCAGAGNMRNYGTFISMFPDTTLINIRTPRRPDVDHENCVGAGNMRN